MNRLLSSSESFFANLCERGTNTIGVVWTVTGPITSGKYYLNFLMIIKNNEQTCCVLPLTISAQFILT